jgi:hypothetical protein
VTRIERIVVRQLTRTFGATAALRGVNLELQAGTLTFLEGPNGAGKSTLLAVIGTVLKPTAGTVTYEPVGSDPMLVRRHLGWVAHDSHCYPELTARENVELAARAHGVDVGSAWSRVAERVAATALADRRVGTLSRGQPWFTTRACSCWTSRGRGSTARAPSCSSGWSSRSATEVPSSSWLATNRTSRSGWERGAYAWRTAGWSSLASLSRSWMKDRVAGGICCWARWRNERATGQVAAVARTW